MRVRLLKEDGRCKWLQQKMLNQLFPEMIASQKDPHAKTKYMIIDWVSNDNGRVGADLNWMASIGVPLVQTYEDITKNDIVVNTGYDSIYEQEQALIKRGIQIIDEPCPYVRKVRNEFMNLDLNYQYVLLCEPNHIIIKNYQRLFPSDMILVQMDNYIEQITKQHNGKPLYLVPYVTFLPRQVQQVFDYIKAEFPKHAHKMVDLSCMWVKSKVSPIVEMHSLTDEQLSSINDALIITTAKSTNKSLQSLMLTAEDIGLNVVVIGSMDEFLKYEKEHSDSTVLLVRSPIPNNAEEPIIQYVYNNGMVIE